MKLTTNNGRFLIFSEILGIALYYENFEFKKGDGESQTRQKIIRVVRNGQREWDWALNTWGQRPQTLQVFEEKLLNRGHLFFIRKIKTLAIKNSKGQSAILGQGNFFLAPQSGWIISCGYGTTSRRVHQGQNGWELYNFQKVELTEPKNTGRLCNFGTYGGDSNTFGGITEKELIPLNLVEWEELSQTKFELVREFGWFGSGPDEQHLSSGLHREGDYVLRAPFRPDTHLGDLVVYPDRQINHHPVYGWSGNYRVDGYDPLPVEEIETQVIGLGCNRLIRVVDRNRTIVFANFKYFNFPAFWLGYEHEGKITPEVHQEICDNLRMKAATHMAGLINYKLRRSGGVEEKTILLYFKKNGKMVGTPADSLSVGNCAVGTWEWMIKIFPRLPEADCISWQNFPVSIHKEFQIPFEKMEELFNENYRFKAVVEAIYIRENPIGGTLSARSVSQLIFNPIEESIGKIIEKYEAKKLGFVEKD